MTSPISPVSVSNVSSATRPAAPARPARVTTTDDETQSFSGLLGQAASSTLDSVGRLEQSVETYGREAATGNLESVNQLMIDTAEAQLATEITVAVRDRAITAFNDIMRMQV